MARIKMLDTTSHADTGPLRAGEVYEVSTDLANHLKDIGLAAGTTAQTTAARQAELNAPPEGQPTIEEQAAAAGTKPGDQSTESIRSTMPVNPPPEGTPGGR